MLGSLGFESLKEIDPLSKSTLYTSTGISISFSDKIEVSIPIKKGKGASRMSVIEIGNIGIKTCFQHKGNKNEISETAAWVRRALCLDIKRTFFSKSRARKMSITYSASSALNKYSTSDF